MRLSITLEAETYELLKEMAKVQSRTITSQINHLVKTNSELVGYQAFKRHPDFNKMMKNTREETK